MANNKPGITAPKMPEPPMDQQENVVTEPVVEVAPAPAEPEVKAKRGRVVQRFECGGHIEGVMEPSDKIYEKPEGCDVKVWNKFFTNRLMVEVPEDG